MLRNKKIYISLCFLVFITLCCDSFVSAQTNKTLRKHVIIALDRYPGYTDKEGVDDPIRNALSDASIMVPKLLDILTPMLSDSDYVSVVNYSLGVLDDSFDDYTTNTICWTTYENFRKIAQKRWNEIAMNHENEGAPFSMISGAKYFSLHSLFDKNQGNYSNKTYLIDVNDEFFNGNDDYKNEFVKDYKGIGGRLGFADFKNMIIAVGQQYYFEHKREYVILSYKLRDYKAIVYEITPKQAALSTVIDYPAYLGVHRIRGGYQISFDYNNVSPDYHLHRLEICPMRDGKAFDAAIMTKERGSVCMDIDGNQIQGDTLKVMMRGWLEPVDTIYSGVILSPYDDNFKNLTVLLGLPLKNDSKIFGIIPLYDLMWWWYPNDMEKAVLIWDVIGVLLFVALICFVAYKLLVLFSAYRPSNRKIKITHL